MEMNGAEYLICNCIEEHRKKVLLLYDNTSEDLIHIFHSALLKHGKKAEAIKLEVADCHGIEPPKNAEDSMMQSEAIICLTQYSLAHTHARKKTEQRGIVFLSMPDFTIDLLNSPAVFANYHSIMPLVKKYSDLLSGGRKIEVETCKGTKVCFDIENRLGNCCPGMTNATYLLGSPPDIEANIAPIENKTNGVVVVDGSITDRRIGLLNEPVVLTIDNGRVCNIVSENKELEDTVRKIFLDVNGQNAYVVGEFGIGFNNYAKLCGNMLIDEGSRGSIHLGIGSNWTIGGKNKVPFHLDFVLKEPTVRIDDKIVIDQGTLVYEI